MHNPVSIAQITSRLSEQYDSSFHFYLAKSINQLLRKKSYSPEVILFNDLLFLDEDDEFLKRYYRSDESPGRIQLLSNYFMKCRLLPEQMPCLISQDARKFMFKRVKRYGKYKRRMQQTAKDGDSEFPQLYEQYLYSMKTEDMMNESESVQVKKNISYDSSVYDIFQSFTGENQKQKIKVDKKIFSIETNEEEEEIDISQPKELVWDFNEIRRPKVQPKMHLDLNRLPSHYQMAGSNKSRESFSRNNISSLSPEDRVNDVIGFYTGRYKHNRQSEKERQSRHHKMLIRDVYAHETHVAPLANFKKLSEGNFKIKSTKDNVKTQSSHKSPHQNKQHQDYIRILEKIGKKFNSPDSKKHLQNNNNYIKKTSKFKPKDEDRPRFGSAEKIGGGLGSIERLKQATSLNHNRLQTLRYKAMKLIEDPRAMRQVKSTDPTVRNK